MDKILFKSKKKSNSASYYFWIILYLILIAYLLTHIVDNPIFIGIVVLILLFNIGVISRDMVIVGETYFELSFIRIIPWFSTSKKFQYDEIKSIDADLPLTQSVGLFSELASMMSNVAVVPSNNIYIFFKDGRKKKFSSNVYRDAFHTAFSHINKAGNIPITLNDVPF